MPRLLTLLLFIAIVPAALARTAPPDERVMLDERFRVSAGELLHVDIEHADVFIRTGAASEAHVRIVLRASNMDRAVERYRSMDFRAERVERGLSVESDSPSQGSWRDWSNWGSFDVRVEITIPARFDADLRTSHGDVEVASLDGTIRIETSHGDVDAGEMTGQGFALSTSHGDVDVAHVRAERVDVRTSHGDIDLGGVEARSSSFRTSHADVEIRRLSGETEIETRHGDIEIVLAGNAAARFETTHGDIEIGIDAPANYDVDLRGEDVRIDRDLAFVGDLEEDEADGRLGEGGPTLKARTTHGDITLRRR